MGNSQQQVLRQLLERRLGATVDELGALVGLSRTAVNQHLMALERDGYVCKGAARKTGGRPEQIYILTEHGTHQFPKRYSWFSRLLVQTLRDELGEEEASRFMFNLGVKRAAELMPRLVGKTHSDAIDEVVKIMNETGFVARTIDSDDSKKMVTVECKNCVYHDVSKDYPEVCRFDIGLLSGLMGAEVKHVACMQRGSDSCHFGLPPCASTPKES